MRLMFGIVALVATSGSALAQNFRLDLFLTARQESSGTVTDLGTGGSINAVPGTRYRVELRYRIADLTADTVGSRGLVSSQIRLAGSGDGASLVTSLSRSNITTGQALSSAIVNPDATGLDLSRTGLIGPYRGGLLADSDAANGTPSISGFNILPLATSSPQHLGWTDGTTGNPTAANTNAGTRLWSIYSFDFIYNGGTVNFSANATADPQTGNRFNMFTRTGGTNNSVPITSTLSTDGAISFVPSPASVSVLALAGAFATRRRRV